MENEMLNKILRKTNSQKVGITYLPWDEEAKQLVLRGATPMDIWNSYVLEDKFEEFYSGIREGIKMLRAEEEYKIEAILEFAMMLREQYVDARFLNMLKFFNIDTEDFGVRVVPLEKAGKDIWFEHDKWSVWALYKRGSLRKLQIERIEDEDGKEFWVVKYPPKKSLIALILENWGFYTVYI